MERVQKNNNQERNNTPEQSAFPAMIQFKDNRSENTAQLKAQEMANQPIQRKANKTGMPDNLKSGIENLSGMDMSDVKVHYNSPQPTQLQAHAFAQGNQIHIASGQEKHLPHEAWHVVQQKQGRVSPTKQLKDKVNINDDAGLEKEADVMGAKALQMKPKENINYMKQDFGFTDNRPEAIVQRQMHNMVKKAYKNSSQIISSHAILQRFAVPPGLKELESEVNKVSSDIQKTTLSDGSGGGNQLYGSKEWANDTYWAANRKLDEWNLVKELVADGTNVNDAAHIGFGINDTKEADGVGYDAKNNVGIAGENKIVSGGFPQVVENINSALSQLTEGVRANQYNGVPLIARVKISKDSEAFKHLNGMSPSVKKAMVTRWKNRRNNAYKEGLTNWKGKSSLRLWILTENDVLFDETIP